MRWLNPLKVILMVFTLPSHLMTTSLHQWIHVRLKLFCHLLSLSFLAIFLFLQLECLLSHSSKVNGHQVCPHRCENTDSPVCLFGIILLPAQHRWHSNWPFGIVPALACWFKAKSFHVWVPEWMHRVWLTSFTIDVLLEQNHLCCSDMASQCAGLTSACDHSRVLINLSPNHLRK